MSQLLAGPEVQPQPHLQVVPEFLLTDEEIQHFYEEVEQAKQRTEIDKTNTEHLGTEQFQNGYVERYGSVDAAGYGRAGLVGIPRNPITTVPVIATTAWFTSTEGHNLHTGLKFLDAGVPFIIQGAEGSHRPGWRRLRPPSNGINLTDSAAALLGFSHYVAGEHKNVIHKSEREVIGESRGGMVAMGVLALAESYDQQVLMADLTAPCFPRPFSLEDIKNFKDQLIAEPKTMVGLAGKMAMRLLVHYPQTLDLHPLSLVHQLAIGPALFSGEAGDLASVIPGDPIIHVTCFDDDFASMPNEWDNILNPDENENRRITLLKGSHLTIADPETLQYILARNEAYRIIAQHPSGNPTGTAVFDLAHDIVAKQEAT